LETRKTLEPLLIAPSRQCGEVSGFLRSFLGIYLKKVARYVKNTQEQKDEQTYHQLLAQKEQAIRDKQAGPAVGSPEYIKQVSGQVSAETAAGEKYILAPAAVVEGAGLATVAATSATTEAVIVKAGEGVTTAQVAIGTHPQLVQAGLGAAAAYTHTSPPRTPAGLVGYGVVKALMIARQFGLF
jgi:hypothetical protein